MDTIDFKPTNYPSDLSEREWEEIAEYFPREYSPKHRSTIYLISLNMFNESFFKAKHFKNKK